MNPLRWARARFQRWWQARLRPSDCQTLTQRNVYIVPTAPGLLLGATLLVLLVASINFQLNLGYALTFLLGGCSLVGMHLGHATLRGLDLQLLAPQAQFLDASASLGVQLRNPGQAPRYGVGLAVRGSSHWLWSEVPAQGRCTLQLPWQAPRRGMVALPLLTVESRFPMGAFRVWTVWQPASGVLVYPRPEAGAPALPAAGSAARAGVAAHIPVRSEGEWDGLRPYRRGDALKHIAWKPSAKAMASGAGALVSRDTQAPQTTRTADLWLDYGATGLNDKEARLSRLCAWAKSADQQELRYGLRLPGVQIAPASGAAHLHHCLEALALC